MDRHPSWTTRLSTSLVLAGRGLRAWDARRIAAAVAATTVVALVIGFATVLIPNPVFGRDIPPVAWNYPVWILTSVLTGMLFATYVRPRGRTSPEPTPDEERLERRSARFGGAAGILAWFAVGCPVCNKIALLALGYTGALTWFAPVQPFLAVLALVLSAVALVWRLRGEVSCPLPASRATVSS